MALLGSTASAAENGLRIIPQISVGTAGIEPGLALEWRSQGRSPLVLRPEVLLSEDGRIGGGAAVLYDLSPVLPRRHAFAVGPRVVYHNADQYGWDAAAMTTWSYDLVGGMRAWKHAVGIFGTLGVINDREDDSNDLGASIGAFYSYSL